MRALWIGCLLFSVLVACTAARANEADAARDARDQPQALMDVAGIAPGMRVADVFGGGGYWSERLQARVGDDGHVLLLNNAAYAAFAAKDQAERFADGRLAAIERRLAEADNLGLPAASLDRIVMVMALHDVWWVDAKEGWPEIDRDRFLAQLAAALKPGGKLLVVDHAAVDGSGSDAVNSLHRIDEQFLRGRIEAAGLRFEKASDLLRNPDDPRNAHVFSEAIRGRTDRFVHLYLKPAD